MERIYDLFGKNPTATQRVLYERTGGLWVYTDLVDAITSYPTLAEMWAHSARGDHLLIIAAILAGPVDTPSRKKLALTACACAELTAGDIRPLTSIRAYVAGTMDLTALSEQAPEALRGAGRHGGLWSDAANTATEAAWALCFALTTLDVAYLGEYAICMNADLDPLPAGDNDTGADADATDVEAGMWDEAADATRTYTAHYRRCADIVRQHYPTPPRPWRSR